MEPPLYVVDDDDSDESSVSSSRSSRKRRRPDADLSESYASDDESSQPNASTGETQEELDKWSRLELDTIRMLTSRLNLSGSPRDPKKSTTEKNASHPSTHAHSAPPHLSLLTTEDILNNFMLAVESNGWEWAEKLFVRFLQAKATRTKLEQQKSDEASRDMSQRIKQSTQALEKAIEEKEQWKREKNMLAQKYKELQGEVERAKENVTRQSQHQRDLHRRMEIMRGSAPSSLFFTSH